MSAIDVKGPIDRHLARALAQLDQLIDELAFPDPVERAAVVAERARQENPAYQYGVMLGGLNRAIQDMLAAVAQGFSDGSAR